MSDALQMFQYEDRPVRVIMRDGEPWFVAKDVCDVLEVSNPAQAVSRLEPDEKDTIISNDGTPGNPTLIVVNEAGLYALILSSRKPEAYAFKRWITHEVIPSIRKHGAYMTPATLEKVLEDPHNLLELVKKLVDEHDRRVAAESQVEEMRPKALFAESVEASPTTILVRDLAKILYQNGIKIGQNRLYKWMVEKGYLIRDSAGEYTPTQRAIELGLFELIERTVPLPDGTPQIVKTTKVTGRGQIYFANKFLGHGQAQEAQAN